MEPMTALIAGISALVGAVGVALVNLIKAVHGRNQNKKDQLEHEENLLKIGTEMTNVNVEISELRKEMKDLLIRMGRDVDIIDGKLEDFHSEWKDYNIIMLRHDITSVYQNYKSSAAIPQGIYQSTMELYDKYEDLGGNSYVHEIVEEIKTWKKT